MPAGTQVEPNLGITKFESRMYVIYIVNWGGAKVGPDGVERAR